MERTTEGLTQPLLLPQPVMPAVDPAVSQEPQTPFPEIVTNASDIEAR